MSDLLGAPTDLEKKSLEAHVDLCAQRYRFLEEKLDLVEEKINKIESMVESIAQSVQAMAEKRNDQMITWGVGIIATLAAAVAYLLVTYALK